MGWGKIFHNIDNLNFENKMTIFRTIYNHIQTGQYHYIIFDSENYLRWFVTIWTFADTIYIIVFLFFRKVTHSFIFDFVAISRTIFKVYFFCLVPSGLRRAKEAVIYTRQYLTLCCPLISTCFKGIFQLIRIQKKILFSNYNLKDNFLTFYLL